MISFHIFRFLFKQCSATKQGSHSIWPFRNNFTPISASSSLWHSIWQLSAQIVAFIERFLVSYVHEPKFLQTVLHETILRAFQIDKVLSYKYMNLNFRLKCHTNNSFNIFRLLDSPFTNRGILTSTFWRKRIASSLRGSRRTSTSSRSFIQVRTGKNKLER